MTSNRMALPPSRSQIAMNVLATLAPLVLPVARELIVWQIVAALAGQATASGDDERAVAILNAVTALLFLIGLTSLASLFVLRQAHYPISMVLFGATMVWPLWLFYHERRNAGTVDPIITAALLTYLGIGLAGLFVEIQQHRRSRGLERATVE